MLAVKVHPQLGWAALNQRLDRHYRLWLIARALHEGGKVSIPQLIGTCNSLKGLSKVTVRKLIRTGEGLWWRKHRDTLYLVGLEAICHILEVPHISPPVIAPMPETLKDFRALCTFAFAQTRDRPTSQTTISKQVNRTTQTVRNYKTALGDDLETKENYQKGGNLEDPRCFLKNGEVVSRMPNTYSLQHRRGAKGNVRKVNRALRSSGQMVGLEHRSLYCTDPRSAARRLQAMVEGDCFWLLVGAGLWLYFAIWNGQIFAG